MYTKLFSSITDSTIWRESDHIRIVWITMLAMADKHGYVASSVPGLADRARVSLENTVDALQKLSSADEWSRSKEYDGKRIEQVGGGWNLLNYTKYRKIRDEEERKEYMRNYMRKRRSKLVVSNVSNVNSSKPQLSDMLAHTEAEEPPLTPPSGGTKQKPNGHVKLTPRELKRVTAELQQIAKASIGSQYDLAAALEKACMKAGIDFERARYMLNAEET